MGKVSPISIKYMINAIARLDGVVEKPDIIGAIFGQTEGLLGKDLELRELQKSGRIGRIEVDLDTKEGKTSGEIIIPSSMDRSDTAIIAASLETIQRIGPCNAKIDVKSIEDVRVSKREYLVERAKEILKNMMDKDKLKKLQAMSGKTFFDTFGKKYMNQEMTEAQYKKMEHVWHSLQGEDKNVDDVL